MEPRTRSGQRRRRLGTVTVDGERYELGAKIVYTFRWAVGVSFESSEAENPAKFYLVSTPAHARFETKHISAGEANKLHLGAAETSNVRTVYQFIIPGVCQSSQLVLGLTSLEAGSVWNTCPPHLHERRSEVYCFRFGRKARLCILWTSQDTRTIVMANEEVVLSPPWSSIWRRNVDYRFVWRLREC